MSIRVTRPQPDEYEKGFANYIALAPELDDAVSVLAMQREHLVHLTGGLGGADR